MATAATRTTTTTTTTLTTTPAAISETAEAAEAIATPLTMARMTAPGPFRGQGRGQGRPRKSAIVTYRAPLVSKVLTTLSPLEHYQADMWCHPISENQPWPLTKLATGVGRQ